VAARPHGCASPALVPQVNSLDGLEQYDPRLDLTSPGSMDRLQALLDASLHGSRDGGGDSRHGTARGGGSRGGAAAEAGAAPAAAGAAAAGAGHDYQGAEWNKPPPAFRFDFGGWQEPTAAAAAAPTPAPPAGAAAPAGAGMRPTLGLHAPGAANGTVRAGGHFDRRMHGSQLYRNQLAPHQPGLAPVRE
jgi:hypothetical protein